MTSYFKSGISLLRSFLSVSSKIILVLGVVIAVISIFAKSIFPNNLATDNKINTIAKQRAQMYAVVNNPSKNITQPQKNIMTGFRIMTCLLIGETCDLNIKSPMNDYKKSIIGRLSGAVALPFLNPPASGVYAVNHTLSNFALIPKSYAAEGIGFASLSPLFNVWKALRDVALMIIVIVIIVIGFLIMFRMKLNPQTVISVENALPKIIVAMLLITFSFAIVGFLIDLMYVLMALIITILGPQANIPSDQLISKFLLAGPDDLFSLFSDPTHTGKWFGDILFSLPQAMMRAVPIVGDFVQLGGAIIGFWRIFPWIAEKLFSNSLIELFNIDFGVGLLGADGAIIGIAAHIITYSIIIPTAFSLASIIVPFIIGLMILLTVITLFFRLLMMIFRSYIIIIFLTILSPLILLSEAIPGQSAFSGWIRTIFSELITFPALVAILLLGLIITDATGSGFLTQFPFLYGINGNSLSLILGMMLMFLTPDLIKKVKLKIQPKPMGLDNAGLGVFVSGGAAGIGALGGWKSLQSLMTTRGGRSILPGPLQSLMPKTKAQENKDLADAIAHAQGATPPTPPPAGPRVHCLPPSTLIKTPSGTVPVFRLKLNMPVMSIDISGNQFTTVVMKIAKVRVSTGHKVSRVTLSDGRVIVASTLHPTIDLKTLLSLEIGSKYDGATIIKNKTIPYNRKYTYDILVGGETSFYFANDIPLASTLKKY